jgi:hypothetical protein
MIISDYFVHAAKKARLGCWAAPGTCLGQLEVTLTVINGAREHADLLANTDNTYIATRYLNADANLRS